MDENDAGKAAQTSAGDEHLIARLHTTMSPGVQWEKHKALVKRLLQTSRAAGNLALWNLGRMYLRLKEDAGIYFEDNDAGQAPDSMQALCCDFNLPLRAVQQARRLAEAYSANEAKEFADLPTEALLEAAGIPTQERHELLKELGEQFRGAAATRGTCRR